MLGAVAGTALVVRAGMPYHCRQAFAIVAPIIQGGSRDGTPALALPMVTARLALITALALVTVGLVK